MFFQKALLILAIGAPCAFGLELKPSDFDGIPSCTALPTDPSLDSIWITKPLVWRTSIWSRPDFYRVYSISLGEKALAALKESDLQNICFQNVGLAVTDQFIVFINGRLVKGWLPWFNPFRIGTNDWVFEKKYIATNIKVKTDNKTYYCGVNKWFDGSWGFYISSPNGAKVSDKDLEEIWKKLEEFGFKTPKESAVFLKEDCPGPLPTKVSLPVENGTLVSTDVSL